MMISGVMGECLFWYWPTRGRPGQRAVKRQCVCSSSIIISIYYFSFSSVWPGGAD